MTKPDFTWEQAVRWLLDQSESKSLVRACYFDDPICEAAQRFAGSDEWAETRELISEPPGRALDLGAGRGIASFALARDGWEVCALEPDPSALVGAAAIRHLVLEAGVPLEVVEHAAETMPFDDSVFDVIYARGVLHHAADLQQVSDQVFRVLKPNGIFFASREHVISKRSDRDLFLAAHPLHKLYGGENAFLLHEYLSAFSSAGFRRERVIGPFDSPINYFPSTRDEWFRDCVKPLMPIFGYTLSLRIASEGHRVGRYLLRRLSSRMSRHDDTPGRLYSFVLRKPRR